MSYDFLRSPETPEEREQLRTVANSIVTAGRIRRRRIRENAELFQKKYGIKYCPFHALSFVESVEPNAETIRLYGNDYEFTHIKCATWKLCQSNISFDKGLIERIKNEEKLIEVESQRKTKCVTCGNNEGRIYFTGLHIPAGDKRSEAVKLNPEQIFLGKNGLYLFERSCHTYLVANSGSSKLNPKNPQYDLDKIFKNKTCF